MNKNEIKSIKEIPLSLEGILLVTAIGLIMTKDGFTTSTPEEIYNILVDLTTDSEGKMKVEICD